MIRSDTAETFSRNTWATSVAEAWKFNDDSFREAFRENFPIASSLGSPLTSACFWNDSCPVPVSSENDSAGTLEPLGLVPGRGAVAFPTNFQARRGSVEGQIDSLTEAPKVYDAQGNVTSVYDDDFNAFLVDNDNSMRLTEFMEHETEGYPNSGFDTVVEPNFGSWYPGILEDDHFNHHFSEAQPMESEITSGTIELPVDEFGYITWNGTGSVDDFIKTVIPEEVRQYDRKSFNDWKVMNNVRFRLRSEEQAAVTRIRRKALARRYAQCSRRKH